MRTSTLAFIPSTNMEHPLRSMMTHSSRTSCQESGRVRSELIQQIYLITVGFFLFCFGLVFFCFFGVLFHFLFLAALCGIWDLRSRTRDGILAPCSGSMESQPLDHQGSLQCLLSRTSTSSQEDVTWTRFHAHLQSTKKNETQGLPWWSSG